MSIHNDIRDPTLFNDKLDPTLSRDVFCDYAGMISEFLSCVIENINIRDTTHFLFVVSSYWAVLFRIQQNTSLSL